MVSHGESLSVQASSEVLLGRVVGWLVTVVWFQIRDTGISKWFSSLVLLYMDVNFEPGLVLLTAITATFAHPSRR